MTTKPHDKQARCKKCKQMHFYIKFEYATGNLAPVCINCGEFNGLEFVTDW